MDTPYTQGFRAGQDYENTRIITYLLSLNEGCDAKGFCEKCDFREAIAGLIRGETNE